MPFPCVATEKTLIIIISAVEFGIFLVNSNKL